MQEEKNYKHKHWQILDYAVQLEYSELNSNAVLALKPAWFSNLALVLSSD